MRKSLSVMKDGRIYFVYSDDKVIGFTRTGETDALVFVNRSGEKAVIGNAEGVLSRFENIQPLHGEFNGSEISVEPYGYTIVTAKFLG